MSAQAAKLMGNSFCGKMIEGLDLLPTSSQESIKGLLEMFNEAVCNNPCALRHVSDFLERKEMCIKAVEAFPWQLKYVPDHFKTQECAIRQCAGMHGSWKMSLIILKLKRFATR